jgi:molecular chaperone GrpE
MTDDRPRDTNADNEEERPAAGEDQEIEITEVQGLPSDAPPPSARPEPEPEEESRAALSTAIEKLEDDLLRVRADFENYRKRQEKGRAEFARQATAGLVEQLLPVIDNFKRALAVADEGDGRESGYRDGVRLIYKQFMEIMEAAGLETIQSEGQPFDPNYHEAVALEPTAEVEANIVLEELEPGYRFRDRLLKPARVRVSAPPPES